MSDKKKINEHFDSFRKDFSLAVSSLEEQYGIKMKISKINYDDLKNFSGKIEAFESQDGKTIEQIEFEKHCFRYGLKTEDYKMVKSSGGKVYELYGFNIGARKNRAKIRDISSKKEFKCSLKFFLSCEDVEEI